MLGSTPDKLSVIEPETVTGTILPLAGQSDDGLAETLTTGGVRSMFTAAGYQRADVAGIVERTQSHGVACPAPLICVEAVLPATTVTGPLSIQ